MKPAWLGLEARVCWTCSCVTLDPNVIKNPALKDFYLK